MRNLNIAKIKIHIENTIFFLLLLLLFDEFAYGRCVRTQRQYDRIECVCVWNEVNTRKKTTIKEAYEFNYRHRHTTYYIHREYWKMYSAQELFYHWICLKYFWLLPLYKITFSHYLWVNWLFAFYRFPICLTVCLFACLLDVCSVRQTHSGVFSFNFMTK